MIILFAKLKLWWKLITADEVKTSASVDVLKDLFAKFRGVVPMLQPALVNDVKKTDDLGITCDKVSDKLVHDFDDKRSILEETDIYERALLTIAFLEKEIQRANIKNDIMLKAKENIEDSKRNIFLEKN